MIYPLLRWTESDVWQFLHEQGLPTNPCYKQTGRVGCMFCPFSNKKQIDYYETQYPKFKERLMYHLALYWETRREHKLSTPEEYYNWWKSRENIDVYQAKQAQTKMNFDVCTTS